MPRAAFYDSFVHYVVYMGLTERYPDWFQHEVLDDILMDADRYTFWVPEEERKSDYYEKTLVEDYSVFIRKSNGEIFCTTYDAFTGLYDIYEWYQYDNSGIAAWYEDSIEYVECQPGSLTAEYPDWFYEYFTESVHFPQENESIFIYDLDLPISSLSIDDMAVYPLGDGVGQVAVTKHCVFLRNEMGEIRHMDYDIFIKHYNPGPYYSLNDEVK